MNEQWILSRMYGIMGNIIQMALALGKERKNIVRCY